MMWMLLDERGKTVRTGEERATPLDLRRTLEVRFPGIRIADVTVSPWIGSDGQPILDSQQRAINFTCVWLAVGSLEPDECLAAHAAEIIQLQP